MNLKNSEGKHTPLLGETAEELYENAPCGYLSFVRDGTIVKINQTLLSWLGYERKEVVDVMKIQALLSIGGKIYFETHFFPSIRMHGFIKEINFDLVKKNRSALPALLNVNEIAYPEGNQSIYRATIFDITDRKKYEKELLEARKKAESAARAKAEFLATISHEIRTPLNAIVGISNLIHKTPLTDQQKEYAQILKFSSDNLLELVNNILDFSKIEKGKISLEERVFSLKTTVHTIMHTLEIKANEKGIDLISELDEKLPDYLIGDPLKLNQILTNLIGNAVKFTKEGFVKLSISLAEKSEQKARLQVKVTDTGIGIPKDKLQTIFDEFSQASYDVNLGYGGTGLGLTISQKLLQLHGSQMEVKSEEGKGAEFSFNIDYKISKEQPKEKTLNNKPEVRKKLESARLLVVDDTPVNISIIQEYFKEWKISCDSAPGGQAALDVIQQQHYDLILMDLKMPDMNGYQATEAIRKLDLLKQPVIIALSASTRGNISEKLRLSGFNDYIPKPFNPTDLYNTLLFHLSTEENVDASASLQKEHVLEEAPEDDITANEEPFELSYYVKVTNNSESSLDELLKKTTKAFEVYKEQFTNAIEMQDVGKLDDLAHKIKMTLYYVQAKKLGQFIQEARELVNKEEKDPKQCQKKLQALQSAFQEVIDGLKSVKSRDLIGMNR